MASETLAVGINSLLQGATTGFGLGRQARLDRNAAIDRQNAAVTNNFQIAQKAKQQKLDNLVADTERKQKVKQFKLTSLQKTNSTLLNIFSKTKDATLRSVLGKKIDSNNVQIADLQGTTLDKSGVPTFGTIDHNGLIGEKIQQIVTDHVDNVRNIDKAIKEGAPGAKEAKKLEQTHFVQQLTDLNLQANVEAIASATPDSAAKLTNDLLKNVTPDPLDKQIPDSLKIANGFQVTDSVTERDFKALSSNVNTIAKITGQKQRQDASIAQKNKEFQAKVTQESVELGLLQQRIAQEAKNNPTGQVPSGIKTLLGLDPTISLSFSELKIAQQGIDAAMKETGLNRRADVKATLETVKLNQGQQKIDISAKTAEDNRIQRIKEFQAKAINDARDFNQKQDALDSKKANNVALNNFKGQELAFREREVAVKEKQVNINQQKVSLIQDAAEYKKLKDSRGRIIPVSVVDAETRRTLMTKDVARIKEIFDPSFVGPLDGRLGKLQAATIGLSDREKEFRTLVLDIQNSILYLKSGKQINEQEFKRLRAALPDPNNPNSNFLVNLDKLDKELTRFGITQNEKLKIAGYRTFDEANNVIKLAGVNPALKTLIQEELSQPSADPVEISKKISAQIPNFNPILYGLPDTRGVK